MENNQNEIKDQKENALSRGIYVLPNLLTVSSLFAGFYAIVAALKGFYTYAAISIFVAMVMDGLDGRVARMTNTMTKFGAELDSLTDMVSFGVAPAIVLYSWSLESLGKVGWLAAFIYVVAVALRLARFNTQIGKADKKYFQGISSTAGAGFMASIVWIGQDLDISPHALSILLAFITVITGALMVSNIRYSSFKDVDLKKHVSFVVMLIVVLAVVLISIEPAIVLFALFSLYLLSGPVGTVWGLHKRKQLRKKMLVDHSEHKTNEVKH